MVARVLHSNVGKHALNMFNDKLKDAHVCIAEEMLFLVDLLYVSFRVVANCIHKHEKVCQLSGEATRTFFANSKKPCVYDRIATTHIILLRTFKHILSFRKYAFYRFCYLNDVLTF